MNAKVLKAFRDKYTGKRYVEGDVLKNISRKRFEEILTKGALVEEIVDEEPKPKKKKATKKEC